MLFQEFGQALRSLRRAPGFAVTSVLTIGLGVGAGTATFSLVKAVLLNPLPYPEPEQLAWVGSLGTDRSEMRTSLPDSDDWRGQNRSFSTLAAYTDSPFLTGGGVNPEQIRGAIVTEDFFATLGVRPAMGRLFRPEEHVRGAVFSGVVIGHGLWERAYGKDPAIIGRVIKVLGWPATVIGVMPRGFAFPAGTELWASARAIGEGNVRDAHNYWVLGRLRQNVSIDAANSEISRIAHRLKQEYPGPNQAPEAAAGPLSAHLTVNVRTPILLVFGAAGVLLLIACVNVATLLLARAASRTGELSVRLALGARRRHLFRYLALEAFALTAAGAAAGVLLAAWLTDLLRGLLPAAVPRAGEVRIDAGVLLFTLAVSAAASLLFAALPAWQAALANVHAALKSCARGAAGDRRALPVQGALVVAQVALSMVLLAGAGLLIESFLRLRAIDPGFRAAGVLSADLSFPMNAAEARQIATRYRDLLEKVHALPGVESAAIMKDLPFHQIRRDGHFFIQNRGADPPGGSSRMLDAAYRIVSPRLMETLRIPLVSGRHFTESDSGEAPPVVIVNAEMARRYWPGRSPIGERIWFDSFEPRQNWRTIVGIAADIRQDGLTEPVRPEAYVCYAQIQIKPYLVTGHLLVRAAAGPEALIPQLRQALREVHPEAAASFRAMDGVVAGALARQRFQMQVLIAFALLAVILASIGLYGLLSYAVARQRPAIGIRMALGAQPPQVLRLVVARALRFSAIGAALGLLGCFALRGVLRKVVYGIGPSDPAVMLGAAGMIFAVALAACWFPARRAMRVDPVSVLREE